jgi:hypothetical protein
MKLRIVLEAIREEAIIKIFSSLVTAINNLADVIPEDGISKDNIPIIEDLRQEIEIIGNRIERLNIDEITWDSVSSSMIASKNAPGNWREARSFITKGIVKRIISSIDQVIEAPYGKESKKAYMILRQRVVTAQEFLTGAAPVGMAAAAAVDNPPEASDNMDQFIEDQPEKKQEDGEDEKE